MELPVSEFSVMYPEGMTQVLPTEGTLNINYNHFMILDSLGFQTETIELGGSTIPKNVPYKKMLYKQILVQAKQVALERGFTLLEEFSGKSTFEGKEYNMFRAIGEVNSIYYQLSGRYFILGLIIEPNRNNRNGVFVTMMANQNSTIENFEDFATKGCISKVWQSIHFDNKE